MVGLLRGAGSRLPPELLEKKEIVLDILAATEDGTRIDVEMQMRNLPGHDRPSLFYLGRVMASQLGSGEDYTRLRPVIGIRLLAFDLFPDRPDQAHWRFGLRDSEDPAMT